MTDAATLLQRLRSEPSHVDALVELALADLLATPARALLDPAALAGPLAAGLRDSIASAGLRPWIERELAAALALVRPSERPLREFGPPALPGALAGAARRPFTPGRELVRAAVHHAAMRGLMRSILHSTLLDFGKKLWSAVPDTSWIPGAGLRSKLVGVAKGVASAVGSESMLEERVRVFVDGALVTALDMVVERISDPRFAGEMAQWRADLVPAMAAQPQRLYVAELHKLKVEEAVADVMVVLEAVASWPALEQEIAAALALVVEALGERSVGAILEGSGLVEAWRPLVQARARERAGALIEGEAFAGWLRRLCEEA
jgi:hypothetical protein